MKCQSSRQASLARSITDADEITLITIGAVVVVAKIFQKTRVVVAGDRYGSNILVGSRCDCHRQGLGRGMVGDGGNTTKIRHMRGRFRMNREADRSRA